MVNFKNDEGDADDPARLNNKFRLVIRNIELHIKRFFFILSEYLIKHLCVL